jgi:uncharacterized membrane protein YoaK (UPF0700 family)
MPAETQPELSPRRVGVALALTAVAGFVDVFSWLELSHVYAATASGNTVLIAVHAAAGEGAAALLYAFTVELSLRQGFRRVLAPALMIEAAALVALGLRGARFIASGAIGSAEQPQAPLFLLLALAALTMGVQNTSLRMAGVVGVFTTHVTGTLTRFGEALVKYLFSRFGRPFRDSDRRGPGGCCSRPAPGSPSSRAAAVPPC